MVIIADEAQFWQGDGCRRWADLCLRLRRSSIVNLQVRSIHPNR
jgi:hypothetical protein